MTKYNIGIDLGGTKILTCLIQKSDKKILFEVKKKTKKEKGNEKVLSKIFETLDELFEISKIKKDEIGLISIACAGQIDKENGILVDSSNLECKNLEIKKNLEEKYNIKTYVLNDVEASTIGELLMGSAVKYNNVVCIFIGTGIGSAIVINRKIYNGQGFAGEIGHTIVQQYGKACACGAEGCLEAYASRGAIEKNIKNAIKKGRKSLIQDFCDLNNISTKHIKTALDGLDSVVLQAVEEAEEFLSTGIANVINFLNPELIILGGGLIQGIDEIYNKTIYLAKNKALRNSVQLTEFKKAKLEDYSGVLGASLIEEYNNA